MVWLWINLSLGALFVLAIVGIPLWMVIARPDTGPKPGELPARHRQWAAIAHDRRRHRTAAMNQHLARQHAATRPGRPATRLGRPATER